MSRPNVTDEIVDGLGFARACVLDQRVASHNRKDHSWDKRYEAALTAMASAKARTAKTLVKDGNDPALNLHEAKAILLADHVLGVSSYFTQVAAKDVRVRGARDAWKILVRCAQERFDAAVKIHARKTRPQITRHSRGKRG